MILRLSQKAHPVTYNGKVNIPSLLGGNCFVGRKREWETFAILEIPEESTGSYFNNNKVLHPQHKRKSHHVRDNGKKKIEFIGSDLFGRPNLS